MSMNDDWAIFEIPSDPNAAAVEILSVGNNNRNSVYRIENLTSTDFGVTRSGASEVVITRGRPVDLFSTGQISIVPSTTVSVVGRYRAVS